ncbi:uncharacterized protein VP01_9980g1 [Puccinia sorghi]|uniref:Uncharacterized protein n=1 Tax=Puccinia sorghi TaxID=27349 RepID=A0A0L6U5Q8_9BASI|nr:uncharacterized protein VP01_9980g1 [Puccinia sorghi]
MDQFLNLCHIDPNDIHTCIILSKQGIRHWLFFLQSSEEELGGYGLMPGACRSLMQGIRMLNTT